MLDFDLSANNFLLVYCFQDFPPAFNRRFCKTLTVSQLQQNFTFLKFLFILFECFVDILAVF